MSQNKFLTPDDLVRAKTELGIVFDAAPQYGYSGVLPALATTAVYPTLIPQVLQALKFEQIAQPVISGDLGTTHVLYGRENLSGHTRPYTDWSYDGSADFNLTFLNRAVYNFQTNINAGDKEIIMAAKLGLLNVDVIAKKRQAAAYQLARTLNSIGFLGITGQNTYGLLNDPSLAAAIALPQGAALSTTWAKKTPTEIINDIMLMLQDIISRAGGNIDIGSTSERWLLVLAPTVATWLAKPNAAFTLNSTPLSWIQQTFPNIEIISVPEYQIGDGTTGNYAQLILAEWNGTPTVQNLMTYRYMDHGLIRDLSGFKGKNSAGSAGAGIVYPMFISTSIGS